MISDWSIIPGDKTLNRALKRAAKKSNNPNITILDYQKDQLDTALKFVNQFRQAIDAGANYGLMSFHLNSKFQKVHAFEINTPVRNCLKENVLKFQLNNVEVYDCGLGEENKLVDLILSSSTFSTHINPNSNNGNFPIKTIDSLNLNDIDFIKIDCEGFEPFIIKGGLETIEKYKPVILMERKGHTVRYGLDKFEPVRILNKIGYETKINYNKDCIMTYEG